jgi:hypothetical protein
MLADYRVNVRLKLALLWATIMALYIYADYFNLMTPHAIQDMVDLQTPIGPTTPGVLIGFSVLLIIPALMIPASLFLRPALSKWLNIVFGLLYGLISVLIILSDAGSRWMAFFVLYQLVELFIFFLIVRSAWQWPGAEAVQEPVR